MNLAGWCIQNNRTAIVIFLTVALAGVYTFFTISRLEDPEFKIRTAVVVTRLPGATPAKMEQLVTDKIEKRVRSMAEVERVNSQSRAGISIVNVNLFERYTDLEPIWARLRNKIDDVRPELPTDVIGPTVDDEFGDVFGVVIALTGDGYTYRELKDYARDVRDALLQIDSVGKVETLGEQEERIFVEFSNARFAESGYSPFQIADVLAAQNAVQSSGSARLGPDRVVLEASGEFKSVDDLRRASVRPANATEPVYLRDLAKVRRGYADPPSAITRINGERAVWISVNMAKGFNIIEMGAEVRETLERLERDLPVGLEFEEVVYQPMFIDRSIGDFLVNLGQAFVFVILTMLIFVGLRTGIIIGLLVPMAMLMCIAIMPAFDISLQRISIAALIIALGMLVDNGVVVSENILVRLRQPGSDRLAAVSGATAELWKPLLAASLTTICAFLPIATAESAVGEYCYSLFVVVSLTLLSSWLLSITFVPFLCYVGLRPKAATGNPEGNLFTRLYRRVLVLVLKLRLVFVVVVIGLFVGAGWAFGMVPQIFFPPNEREMFTIDFWQPFGTDLETTGDRVAELEQALLADPAIAGGGHVGSVIGQGSPRWYLGLNIEQSSPNYAFLVVTTKTVDDVESCIQRTRALLATKFPDARATVRMLENGTPVGTPVQVRLSGRDLDQLYALREKIVARINTVDGIVNVHDDWGEWTKKLRIDVDQDRAKIAGFTSRDVALSLQMQFSGYQFTEYREGRESIPVVLRATGDYRKDLSRIDGLNVYSYSVGNSVPLKQIADATLEWKPSNIRRRDEMRTMTIKADLIGRLASDALAELEPKVRALEASDEWVNGYRVEFGGEGEEAAKAQGSILVGLPMAMALLLLVLVSQFNSLRRPAIILLTVPPMLVGIVAGLLLTSAPFGFMAMLGMISLMGIIVNNAIMMIDRIEIERRGGLDVRDAIVAASVKRLRPIVSTATTTIVGLVPLAMSGDMMWVPMAVTIIGGLAFATVLTLFLCPVLYAMFFRARYRGYRFEPKILTSVGD